MTGSLQIKKNKYCAVLSWHEGEKGQLAQSGSLFEAGDGQAGEDPGPPLDRDRSALPALYGAVAERGGEVFHPRYDLGAI